AKQGPDAAPGRAGAALHAAADGTGGGQRPAGRARRAAAQPGRPRARVLSRETSMRLSGKRAIVTGAGSGIGRASAILFASEGAQVLAVDLTEGVEETRAAIEKDGGRCLARKADAADEETVKELVPTPVPHL